MLLTEGERGGEGEAQAVGVRERRVEDVTVALAREVADDDAF